MEANITSELAANITHLTKRIAELTAQNEVFADNMDMFFLITMGLIIYFMQCGFAFLECGSVRSKNTTNILIKNFMESFIAAIAYWIIGFPLAFGGGNPFCGVQFWAHHGLPDTQYAFWFFQFVFAATASTIVSGAVAERCDFVAYIIYSVWITGVMYPIVTHWAWSDEGWLKAGFWYSTCTDGQEPCDEGYNVSFYDFAGSSVVHLVGGTAAFVGAAFLGPRRGRFDEKGNVVQIKGHSVPLAALGGFILFFGFFAFNGGSQAQISKEGDGAKVATACINTIISGTMGAFTCLAFTRVWSAFSQGKKYWSLLQTMNGALAGMVAICASAELVRTWAAAVIGLVAGCSYLLWSAMVLKLRVDDPLDAAAVHAGGGIWGVIARPILDPEIGVIYRWNVKAGLHFGWNVAGAFAIMAWSAFMAAILFGLLKLLGLLRVSKEIEDKGLDIPKHGEAAYPVLAYGHGWTTDNDMLHNVMDVVNDTDTKGKPETHTVISVMVDPNTQRLVRRHRFENSETEAQMRQMMTDGGVTNVAYIPDAQEKRTDHSRL